MKSLRRVVMFPAVLLVVSALCPLQTGIAQGTGHPTLWDVSFSAGYAYSAPDIVSQLYELILDSYRNSGVPVSTQTPFGSALGIQGGFRFSRLETISFGLTAGYWYAPAYSSYQDYAGTLKVNGTNRSLEISLTVRDHVASLGEFPVNITVQAGVSHSTFEITEDVQFKDFPERNYHSKWTGSAWGPCCQATIGSSVAIGDFVVCLDGGYKFAWNPTDKRLKESTAGTTAEHYPWDIGQSGPVVMASVEMRL